MPDTSVILYAAEIEAPALKETARLVLEAEADRFGVPLDVADVLLPPDRGLRRQNGITLSNEGSRRERARSRWLSQAHF